MTHQANPTSLNESALIDVITAKLQALGTIGDELAQRTPEHSANWILGTLNQLPSLLNDLNT